MSNPLLATQNIAWTKSKGYGFRMLSKMGWKPGEGIGKNPGTKEQIYVPIKTDLKGIGTGNVSEAWLGVSNSYASILNKLKLKHGSTGSISSPSPSASPVPSPIPTETLSPSRSPPISASPSFSSPVNSISPPSISSTVDSSHLSSHVQDSDSEKSETTAHAVETLHTNSSLVMVRPAHHKRMKSRDVSRYSSEELATIFGYKSGQTFPQTEGSPLPSTSPSPSPSPSPTPSFPPEFSPLYSPVPSLSPSPLPDTSSCSSEEFQCSDTRPVESKTETPFIVIKQQSSTKNGESSKKRKRTEDQSEEDIKKTE
eukprot:MONOS_14314.1-p1 / transcript=MONOS_14314.1 / gene=MONOS_14314 / organism=Monocercomonoides_exilis_PA203 / gene_product=unspecified product / transcript_product=unspecified product / location=Mono_scaffold00979:201-1491(-) / protein_length=311 / sequence_SO=supercontig / SO=protein_coding / is_pseudo=false